MRKIVTPFFLVLLIGIAGCGGSSSSSTSSAVISSSLPIGSSIVFYDNNENAVTGKLLTKGNVAANGRSVTVLVFVDASLASETNASAAADAVLSKFIGSGSSESIYGWDTNIFGSEWGSYAATIYPSYFIPDGKTISILLFDIDGDGSDGTNGVFTVGFFWLRDTYLRSLKSHYSSNSTSYNILAHSNQTMMFYIDLPFMLKTLSTEKSWSTTGYYPEEIYGTLAHEFQHMIHWYQKNILYNSDSNTWFNEMCSMVAEDFVADKLGVIGPRGVSDISSAGSDGNTDGYLKFFNYHDMHSLTSWLSDSNSTYSLDDYGSAYAFGAYLARNHGGAPLFSKLVQSETPRTGSSTSGYTYYDATAVINSINAVGGSETLDSLLREWGAAVVLSDSSSGLPSKAQYNTGTSIVTTSGSASYNLGPINLYNYLYSAYAQSGPYFDGESSSLDVESALSRVSPLSPVLSLSVASDEAYAVAHFRRGKDFITKSNRELSKLMPKPDFAVSRSVQTVTEVSSSMTYTSGGSSYTWDLSGTTAANQVSYLSFSSTTPTLTIKLGTTKRNMYLVFTNPTSGSLVAPKIGTSTSGEASVNLNNSYTGYSRIQVYSNAYYHLGGSMTGTLTYYMTIPSGVVVTAIAK
jgi:hypothetical protein